MLTPAEIEAILPYTTDAQADVLRGLLEVACNQNEFCRQHGVSRNTVKQIVARARARAAKNGVVFKAGINRPIADGYKVKGTSALYKDGEDKPALVWVKTAEDRERQMELMQEAIEALKADIPRAKTLPAPVPRNDDLLNCYVITDYHLGMLAWGEETGADWDLEIAEQMLIDWFGAAISRAMPADHAVFAQLGDFLHWDGLEAVTPANKHVLDADTRFQKLVRTAIRVIRSVIDMLLQEHRTVHVLMADANHDPASGAWLREFLTAFYEDEPRITVDNSADTYYCHQFGQTVLFFHHGHKRKIGDIDRVFSAKFREQWGQSKHCYAHLGHYHNDEVKESPLMRVEQHRTLAAADAYASRGGYISGRDAKVITYHREHGRVAETIISPEALK